jgi:hypothetical protein
MRMGIIGAGGAYFLMAATIATVISAIASPQAPSRSVHGNSVVSDRDPAVRITLPADARFVGSDAWLLYGITNCRQFVFVQADEHRAIERLYWVQFEAYLASMPKLHYGYDSPRHATLGGMKFYLDTWVSDYAGGTPQPPDLGRLEAALAKLGYAAPAGINSGSDSEHVFALVTAKGYALPRKRIDVRFVYLPGSNRRKELMVIYSEKFDGTVATHAQIDAAVQRAERAIAISRLSSQ